MLPSEDIADAVSSLGPGIPGKLAGKVAILSNAFSFFQRAGRGCSIEYRRGALKTTWWCRVLLDAFLFVHVSFPFLSG